LRPAAPKPMEVDPSIQTRMVNYINRPQFEIGKRPPPAQTNKVGNVKEILISKQITMINQCK